MVLSEELARVANQLHPDPHSILGFHGDASGHVVRVLRPGALSVVIVGEDGASYVARESHVPGIFQAAVPRIFQGYRVRSEGPLGTREEFDPYAFGPTIGPLDLHLFAEGTHEALDKVFGANPRVHEGVEGTSFVVWAPLALSVRVIGDWNQWSGQLTAMRKLDGGVWEIFLPGVSAGALYKFEVATRRGAVAKSDPFGRAMEVRPNTASRVTAPSSYRWSDEAWMEGRSALKFAERPMSIYEVHLPSFRRMPRRDASDGVACEDSTKRFATYREIAEMLVDHVADLGFTHIELLPVMEHPYDGSWGYQVSGYFAPTSRLGAPDDFRYFVDRCHARGLGVLLDWVPAHFPKDAAALGRFDGGPLFEHWDPRRGEHRQWGTFIFDWGKPQVSNFLIASAIAWCREFHLDGLRVDAVASMLYLDYGANDPSEWEPNIHGGNENLEAVAFLRALNDRLHAACPGVVTMAEESTSWPGVSRPTYAGGLGFDFKWNMGWMHDTLRYFSLDPIFRSYQHALLTFGIVYAYSERYMLPLSHDEVVHLKRSLYGKMSGDPWRMRASLRSLFGYMFAHPGKKLLFMGAELAQTTEWNFATELDWSLERDDDHAGVGRFLRDLNALYVSTPSLFERDHTEDGFRWIDANDADQSIASFIRFPRSRLKKRATGVHTVFLGNFTPIVRSGYRIGVPRNCAYREVLNSDASVYGGSNVGNLGLTRVEPVPSHGYPQSIVVTLPPLGVLFLVPEDPGEPTAEELATEGASAPKPKSVST